MNLPEATERISQMPSGIVGYMLMTYFLKHPQDFEQAYLDGSMTCAD